MKPLQTKALRLTALALSFSTILFSFFACSSLEDEEPATDHTPVVETNTNGEALSTLKIGYTQSDTLSPYTAVGTVNQQLSSLLYDPLFTLDAHYNAVPIIAESYTLSGVTLTVTLKDGVQFTDGTKLTADHVVASFNKAKTAPAYQARLANFKSAKNEQGQVVFTLSRNDPYAVNCLDFAIAKDPDAAVPVGSGRFVLDSTKAPSKITWNSGNIRGLKPKIEEFSLISVSDNKSVNNALKIGNISFVFDSLSSGAVQRVNAATADVSLNNLVFLGVNYKSTLLTDINVRKAISCALNREEIVTTGYQNHATAASEPFNPAWNVYQNLGRTVQVQDQGGAEQLLKNAGYTEKNSSGVYTNNNRPLQLKLVVNSGNAFREEAAQLISEQLTQAGIGVEITTLAYDQYVAAIKAGSYDLYLGEVNLTCNMDLTPLFSKGGSVSYGIDTAGATCTAYTKLLNGEIQMADFLTAFNDELPVIPICFRGGLILYSRAITVPVTSTESDVFCNIHEWTLA